MLNLKATTDANNFNNLLEKYGLNNFQHRLLARLATFVHNKVNIDQAPKLLKEQIVMNQQRRSQFKKQISNESAIKNT